ncbi:orotate phosphoribosyltransferase [Pseudothermotoga thermarum]|uniref:Orotate phosphoribosyltransferase n=1 Tax=Pseudothermotoga thermarum DSM 5069 TaxID=688269 RepID=F7YWH5_9THEM|nr:orotate phosphoribosyltransferase [Pseudothermotoga thermarum]AEH51954.1 orotate phosphoribosyltransferase [Pseudothermotoga thermarum DSM 5069]
MRELLLKTGALLEGHFLLSSGKHSSNYIQCAKIFEYPKYGDMVGEMIARKISVHSPQVVIGPALGGIILAYTVARAIGARALFAEREDGVMKLRRNFEIQEGEKVAIVEDVTTTGGSVMEVKNLVESYGGVVCCIASIVDRSVEPLPFDVPFYSLIKLVFPIYEPGECPLCKQGIPLVKPGSRK